MVSATVSPNQLLPQDRRFQDLLLPFLLPYLVYVAISSVPESILPAEIGQGVKLVGTGAVLFYFRKTYRFGLLRPVHIIISILALPFAMVLWMAPFYLLSVAGWFDMTTAAPGASFSTLFFILRLFNTVVLVAVFEELFLRVYVMGWMYQAGVKKGKKGVLTSLLDTLEQRPVALEKLPLSRLSVLGSTIVFTAGHHTTEYLSCGLYFLFTTWLYKKTGSLWVCIFVHGLTNFAIALLVRGVGMVWLW